MINKLSGETRGEDRVVLAARELTKIHTGPGEFRVHEVNLSLYAGQLAVLRGRSGSGKTTLLLMLGLLSKPSGGHIELCGRSVGRIGSNEAADMRRKNIGFVFQSFNLLPQLTAADNIKLARDRSDRSAAVDVEHLLRLVGLWDRRHHRPDQLSAGEQQRVAFARALVNRPALLLADEPTGNLDETNEDSILGLLASYAAEGHAVLVVSHSKRVAERGDVTMSMDRGTLVSDGTAR